MAKDPRTVLTEAAQAFIMENAGAWASSVVAYVPGLVQAQLADLSKNHLHIDVIPLPGNKPIIEGKNHEHS